MTIILSCFIIKVCLFGFDSRNVNLKPFALTIKKMLNIWFWFQKRQEEVPRDALPHGEPSGLQAVEQRQDGAGEQLQGVQGAA